MKQKIIFLDIDGPIIPAACFYINPYCSWDRSVVSTVAIGQLLRLIRLSGAQIVLNTTHNREWDNKPSIKSVLIAAGIPETAFHPDGPTRYPDIARDLAVMDWKNRNPCDWVAFDDADFTNDERLIWVNPDDGILSCHIDKALELWNIEDNAIIFM